MTKTFQCDRCGRFHKDDGESFVGNLFHDMSVLFGYGSPFDGDLLQISVCELCLFDFFRAFKHRPVINDADVVKAFDMFREKERSYYKDFFIKNYEDLENRDKKQEGLL